MRAAATFTTAGVLALPLGGCGGGDDRPRSDREEIRQVVLGFFRDVVEEDYRAACDKLTGVGRSQAVMRRRVAGRPWPPTSKERCVEEGVPALSESTTLPGVVEHDAMRFRRIRIQGDRARAFTTVSGIDGVQHLVRTRDGWKISFFNPMVTH